MKLPKSWKEVPLKKYIEISEVSLVDMDEIDKAVKLLSILSGKTTDEIEGLDIQLIAKYTKQISFIYTQHVGKGVPTHVWLKGRKYFINNDLKKLTGAEYIDFTSMCKDKNDINANINQILAIFFKPVNWFGFRKQGCYKKSVNGEWIQTLDSRVETAKLLMELPSSTAMELSGFFFRSWENLTKATKNYLKLQHLKTLNTLKKEMKSIKHS